MHGSTLVVVDLGKDPTPKPGEVDQLLQHTTNPLCQLCTRSRGDTSQERHRKQIEIRSRRLFPVINLSSGGATSDKTSFSIILAVVIRIITVTLLSLTAETGLAEKFHRNQMIN